MKQLSDLDINDISKTVQSNVLYEEKKKQQVCKIIPFKSENKKAHPFKIITAAKFIINFNQNKSNHKKKLAERQVFFFLLRREKKCFHSRDRLNHSFY